MSFAQEMKDFHEAYRSMSGSRLQSAQRRKIEWDITPNPYAQGETPSGLEGAGGGRGVGETTAPDEKKSGAGSYDVDAVTAYIRQSAAKHGINPDTAVKVAKTEGLGAGIWQSNVIDKKTGKREPSYGPFQFLVGGGDTGFPTGMGNDFMAKTGLDPRDPKNINAMVDFAMEHASKNGWKSWYGARDNGIGNWEGIGAAGAPKETDDITPEQAAPPTKPPRGAGDAESAADDSGGAIPDEGDQTVVDDGGAEITVVAAPEAAPVEAVQVAMNPDPLGVQDDTLYAAEGGAIPDDTVYYESGGGSYNPARNYTQPIQPAPAAGVPRRVSIPSANTSWRDWGPGGSPTQKAVTAARKKAATPDPVVKPTTQPQGRTYGFGDFASQWKGKIGPRYINQAQQVADNYMKTGQNDPVAFMRAQDQINSIFAQGSKFAGGSGGSSHWGGNTGGGGGGWGTGGIGGGMGGVSSGGLYKKGGKVSDQDAEFEEWVRRYSSSPEGGGGSAGMSPRDRAARTMNRKYRGINSLAWPPSGGGGGERQPAPKGGGGGRKSAAALPDTTDVTPTPRPDNYAFVRTPPERPISDNTFNAPVTAGGNNPLRGRGGMQPGSAPSGMQEYPMNGGAAPAVAPAWTPGQPVPPGFHPERRGMTQILVPDAPAAAPAAPPQVQAAPPQSYPYSFEKGGAIPDDEDKLHRPKGKPWYYQTRAREKPAQTKSSTPVRKSANKPQNRNAAKKGKQGKPRSANLPKGSNAPTPTPRPSPFMNNTVRPEGPAGGMPARGRDRDHVLDSDTGFGIASTQGHPPGGLGKRPPVHFDQATELIPKMPGITINVAPSGSGQPPGSMGVRLPGVNPPVTGTDVPQGGTWAAGQGPPPGPVDTPPTARDLAYPFRTVDPSTPVEQRYARGGAIPDEEGPYPNWRAEEAGYTTSSADANVRSATRARPSDIAMGDPREDRTTSWDGPAELEGEPGRPFDINEHPDMRASEAGAPRPAAPQPRMRDVAHATRGAVDSAVHGLQRLLGLEPQGAIRTPEDEARHDDGARRLASGEGAATGEDVAAIDAVTGVDQMGIQDEGMKNLIRIDKAMNWHLMRGEKDKAEAVGAALLQYGAVKVRQASMMAAAALSEYQESGDPNDLKAASSAIKLAHQLIPDGFNIDIDIDPKTRQVVVTAVDADGKAQKHVVDPQAIPGLLQKAMDGSAYWNAVFQIGQPRMAEQEASSRRAAENKAGDRAYNEDWEQRKYERNQEDALEKEQRAAEAAQEKENRAAAAEQFKHDRNLDEGQTLTERDRVAEEQFYADWGAQYDAAEGPEKAKILQEGLAYRYEHAKDREQVLPDDELQFTDEESQDKYADDMDQIQDIARVIALKNGKLDGPGAMNMARALIETEPTPTDDGRLEVNGYNLVFNPQLLPQLLALGQKYRAQ